MSDLTYYVSKPNKDDPEKIDSAFGVLSYVVVATPDCDLLQDFKARRDGKPSGLFNVLMFAVEEALRVKPNSGFSNGREWKHVEQNEIERFHFLGAIASNDDLLRAGTKDLIVDFKKYFTLSPEEIYRQLQMTTPNNTCRRCRLNDLWREDLQRRAMAYMQRVGLPSPLDAR